jgi:hypothetical protein
MNKIVKIILLGILLWLIPFLVSIPFWDITTNQLKISLHWFDAIMAVTWAITFAIVACLYFSKLETGFAKEGWIVGFSWYIIVVLLDLFVLVYFFKMAIIEFYPLLITYLNTPVLAITIGHICQRIKGHKRVVIV